MKFKPAESVLAYRFVRIRIEKINQHELFRMAGEIIGERIDETLLALKIRAVKAVA